MNREQTLMHEIDTTLRNLEVLLPFAGDKLGRLCDLYASTYILKLRAMKC